MFSLSPYPVCRFLFRPLGTLLLAGVLLTFLAGCPTSFTFGTVAVGQKSPAVWEPIVNSGTTPLRVTGVALGGANPGDFTVSVPATPFTIAPSGVTEAVVVFAPTAAGTRNATVTVTSNSPAGNLVWTLTGTGEGKSASTNPNDESPLGTNLAEVCDWSGEFPFVDAFKTSRDWISGTATTWSDGRTLALDGNYWVSALQSGQWARTCMFWAGSYPAGDYIVLYDGQGTLAYQGAATKDPTLSRAGRDVIHVNPAQGGITLCITATTPGNYVRNIRVIMPGGGAPEAPYSWWPTAAQCPYSDFQPFESTYQTQLFHPAFLNTIKNYKVLRFMDWLETNNSAQQNWTDRTLPTDARYACVSGVPIEILCKLANAVHADAWVCVPHLATDDYVTQMATVIYNTLDPDLHVYIEYSNEVWNTGFGQWSYASQQGQALHFGTNQYDCVPLFVAYRSVQIFTIFEQVFGGTAQLKRVLPVQAAGSWNAEQELMFQNAYQHADALAIAPYFGGAAGNENQVQTESMTLDQLFAALQNTYLPQAEGWIQSQAALAVKYGVQLVAYEGGQHLVGIGAAQTNSTLNTLFDAANRDSRMGTLYTSYLNYWKQAGGGMFVHYLNCQQYTQFGRWGSLEYSEQPPAEAPKFTALQSFIQANPTL